MNILRKLKCWLKRSHSLNNKAIISHIGEVFLVCKACGYIKIIGQAYVYDNHKDTVLST